MKMSGNTVLVTGGTSGIGRALAEAFHHRGNRVIIAGRRRELLDEVASGSPGIVGMTLDVADARSVALFAGELGERFPELNVLLANAGVSRAEDMAADDWDTSAAETIVATNIVGTLRVTAAVLPLLKRQEWATIVATTSNLAFIPRAEYPTYCASKAFLHSWLQSLRHQLRRLPIEVLELAPPYVQTELTGARQASDPARHSPLRLRRRGHAAPRGRRPPRRRGARRRRPRPADGRAGGPLRRGVRADEPGLRRASWPPPRRRPPLQGDPSMP